MTWNRLLWSAIALITISSWSFAGECPTDIKAVTAADPKIPIEVLSHRVKPLTQCELETEAQAWLLLLRDKVTEISNAEVAAIYKKQEIRKTEELEATLDDATQAGQAEPQQAEEATRKAEQALKEAQEAEKQLSQDSAVQQAIKAAESKAKEAGQSITAPEATAQARESVNTALIKHLTDLRAERTSLVDRFKVVLDELEAKGGEIGDYDVYITAVSGIKVDVTEASATWTTITGWLMSPEGGFRWAVNIVQFIVILMVFYLLAIIAGKAARKATSRSKNLSSLLREFLVLTAPAGWFCSSAFLSDCPRWRSTSARYSLSSAPSAIGYA